MSLLRRALRTGERRSTLGSPSEALYDAFTGGYTASGRVVTPEKAARYSNVFACMRALADSATLCPLISYRRLPDGSRERETLRPGSVASLLAWPTPWQPFSSWVWNLLWDLNSWGDAYFAKRRDQPGGPVAALQRIGPRRVYTYIADGQKVFDIMPSTYDELNGRYSNEDILHVYGLSADGVCGLSPIAMAREALSIGMSFEEFVGNFVDNGVTAGFVLTTDGRLTEEAAKRIRRDWREKAHGIRAAGETVILEQGLKPAQLGLPLKDAQFIEQRKYTATEAARVFAIPGWRIGAEWGGSMTYSNVEQEGLHFSTYSMGFWFKITEDHLALDPDLYPRDKSRYPEFLADALLRTDSKVRSEVYSTATGGKPWMWPTEVRQRENLPVGDKEKALDEAAQPGVASPAAGNPPSGNPDGGGGA